MLLGPLTHHSMPRVYVRTYAVFRVKMEGKYTTTTTTTTTFLYMYYIPHDGDDI